MADPNCGGDTAACTNEHIVTGGGSDTCAAFPTSQSANLAGYASAKNSWQWTVPLTTCGIAAPIKILDSSGSEEYYYYDVYFNSQSGAANNDIIQMGQVKFRCKLMSFQEDGESEVTIDEDNMIADKDFKLKLWSYLTYVFY